MPRTAMDRFLCTPRLLQHTFKPIPSHIHSRLDPSRRPRPMPHRFQRPRLTKHTARRMVPTASQVSYRCRTELFPLRLLIFNNRQRLLLYHSMNSSRANSSSSLPMSWAHKDEEEFCPVQPAGRLQSRLGQQTPRNRRRRLQKMQRESFLASIAQRTTFTRNI